MKLLILTNSKALPGNNSFAIKLEDFLDLYERDKNSCTLRYQQNKEILTVVCDLPFNTVVTRINKLTTKKE